MSKLDLEALHVLADRLQAQGDARGELLSLELAAATAVDPSESRKLCTRAQALRARAPDLVWPQSVGTWRGLIRAGLLVCGAWAPRRAPVLPDAVDRHCRELAVPHEDGGLGLGALAAAQQQRGVSLDGLWEQDYGPPRKLRTHQHVLDVDSGLELGALGLRRPLAVAEPLQRLRGLHELHLGSREPGPNDLLETLTKLELRSLVARVTEVGELDALLAGCPYLRELGVFGPPFALQATPGLEQLRRLSLFYSGDWLQGSERLSDDLPLTGLDALRIDGPHVADLERIAAYGLRSLEVFDPIGEPAEILARIAELDSLEHLSIRWHHNRSATPSALSRMPRLRSLELAGHHHGEIEAPPLLERMVFGRGVTHLRVRGQLREVHSESGTIFNLLNTVEFAGVRTLGLSATSGRASELQGIAGKLLGIETLIINGGQVQAAVTEWIAALPRLRTLIWPVLSIRQQRSACEQLPHLQVIGADLERLRQDRPPPNRVEPLAARNWPRP